MQVSTPQLPTPENEPLRSYGPGSEDAKLLKEAIDKFYGEVTEVPLIIGGKEIFTTKKGEQVCPAEHKHVLCRFSQAGPEEVKMAIEAAMKAKEEWEQLSSMRRFAIFEKAAELLAKKYRYMANAATMLGQGKTVWQAEIDSGAESIDFLRFNPIYAQELYATQPRKHTQGCWNRVEYRPLEGFVWALTPFNFTAIGINLPTSPAIMGNVVLWKPASSAILSNYVMMKILIEAGLPPGVINFLPGPGAVMSQVILSSHWFSGLHFTGSTAVFDGIQQVISKNLSEYVSYPRVVGETGGKDFHFVHESADLVNVVNQTIRGAFEYQGQKCSACSRAYIPDTMWPDFVKLTTSQLKRAKMGAPQDFTTFMSAVINKEGYDTIKSYIDHARTSPDAEIVIGGKCDDSVGWFIEPTIIRAKDPQYRSIVDEIFGPVLTVYVYPAKEWREALKLCDQTSKYGLTGAIFGQDTYFIHEATWALRNAEGNFYINDKCTGAVVGQQPFGGARRSGTNDKAGDKWNLIRWCSPRSIKEMFLPLTDFGYPHMGDRKSVV